MSDIDPPEYNIDHFFTMEQPIPKQVVRSAISTYIGHSSLDEEDPYPDNITTEVGQDYAKKYQEAELLEYLKNYSSNKMRGTINTLSQIDDLSSQALGAEQLPGHGLTDVYDKYNFIKPRSNNLTINSKRQEILEAINGLQVTIIEGATGCGKTTQVPQFILDDCYERKAYCNIIVTQPRRIAAISIAKRVCKERDWTLGDLVGYQVGLDANTSENTRLQYVTTGVLLQKLTKEHHMNKYTHIILDEVHERNQEMDFLLVVVRKLLRTNSNLVKVILMSATFNTKKFADYFAIPGPNSMVPSPVLNVTNKTEYNVKIVYLDMIKTLGLFSMQHRDPGIAPELQGITSQIIQRFDELDERDFKAQNIAKGIVPGPDVEVPIGSVLIFLPGIYEIETIYEELYKEIKLFGNKWHLLPLHSTITSEEQQWVFKGAPKGKRKIILSTNIAESSITVPDVKYVIDFCLTKEFVCADDSNFGVLKMDWASKASCNQRAGRVGRVSNGRVYRMVHQKSYQNFRDECRPEIIRAPLSRLILISKQLSMGPPISVLALAMDPPDIRNILKTILLLKEVGGLLPCVDGKFDPTDGDLTFLGLVMATLPLDIHLSKLIFLGWIFDCLDVCVVMAAAMNLKSMFNNSFYDRLKSYDSKLIWSDGCMSDPIAYYNAYRVWTHSRERNYFLRSENMERNWCQRFCLQEKIMKEICALETELISRLRKLRIYTQNCHTINWADSEKALLYKTVLAGAFYPNYFLRTSNVDERESLKILGGRDLYRTVYYTGMDNKQPGELYAKNIKKALVDCSSKDVKVEFDSSMKVYVTFGSDNDTESKFEHFDNLKLNSSIPGKIPLSVYKAMKMRHLNGKIKVKVLPYAESKLLAEEKGIGKMESGAWETSPSPRSLKSCLPPITIKYVTFTISQYIDCGHFWAQPMSMKPVLNNINSKLNENDGKNLKEFDASYKPVVGQICAGLYDGKFYRVRILDFGNSKGEDMHRVFYVDYGNIDVLPNTSLRDFGALTDYMMRQPMCAYEVVLAHIKPSEILNAGGKWARVANTRFINMVEEKELSGTVYSVVLGVVACKLQLGNLDLNKWLVDLNFAEYCEESYQSKANHDARLASRYTQMQIDALNVAQEAPVMVHGDVEPPQIMDCKYTMELVGPHSPLEAHVSPLMVGVLNKTASIDPNSVNSILMTPNPQNRTEPLIVAGDIAQRQNNESVVLRNTTVMPNIDGLPAIIALLFCPKAKLFQNSKWTRYTKILCGLGYDDKEHPLYKEHDLHIDLDVIIDNDDISNINSIRSYMGQIMSLTPNVVVTPQALFELMKRGKYMRGFFKKLWMKKRRLVNNYACGYEVTSWKMTREYKNAQRSVPNEVDPLTQVINTHKVLNLRPDSVVLSAKQIQDCHLRLEAICRNRGDYFPKDIRCEICDVDLESRIETRMHVLSQFHMDTMARLQETFHGDFNKMSLN